MEMAMSPFTWTLFLLFTFMAVDSAAALTCSKCSSQHSMGDCEANSLPENCAEGASVCYEASYAPTKSYSKGCAKSCDNSKLCGANASGDKCKIECCGTNYCNASPWLHRNVISSAIVLPMLATILLKWHL